MLAISSLDDIINHYFSWLLYWLQLICEEFKRKLMISKNKKCLALQCILIRRTFCFGMLWLQEKRALLMKEENFISKSNSLKPTHLNHHKSPFWQNYTILEFGLQDKCVVAIMKISLGIVGILLGKWRKSSWYIKLFSQNNQ